MNIKATLSDITVSFTPDEWAKVARLLSGTVDHVEQINADGDGAAPEPERRTQQKPSVKVVKKGKPGCPECGSPSRHKKDCARSGTNKIKESHKIKGNKQWQELGEAAGKRASAISQKVFERVKLSASHDIPADAIVRELNIPLIEVNRAISAIDYDAYLK